MTPRAASVQRGASQFARSATGPQARIARALELLRREGADVPSLTEISAQMVERVIRRHEQRLRQATERMHAAVSRLMDDLDVLESSGEMRRPLEQRQEDLAAVADSLREVTRLEEALGRRPQEGAELRNFLERQLGTDTPPAAAVTAAAAPSGVRSLDDSRRMGRNVVDAAQEIYSAWQAGRTVEHPGVRPVDVRSPDHPRLVEAMERMAKAVTWWRTVGRHITDPARAARAADRVQRVVSDAQETLRSFGHRFEATTSGDVLPPTQRIPDDADLPAGSRAAIAADARTAVDALDAATPADRLVDALDFSALEVQATGALGEPLDRSLRGVGLEGYVHGSSTIRTYRTRPAWLAARLADLVEGWERAHLIGPGFGGELHVGIMLAPEGVNQVAQNRGIEDALRAMATVSRRSGADEVRPVITAQGRRLAIPLADGSFEHMDVLTQVRYDIPDLSPPRWYQIDVRLDGSWVVTHNFDSWPAGVPLEGTR